MPITTPAMPPSLDPEHCRVARMARDARFDGRFFVAVVTTGIYCRPICPAPAPHERNVRYYASALEAASAGFRPCLRCRPDSAPGSPAWQGTDTTLRRALRLIDEGALSTGNMTQLADRLGIGERHLRGLFQRRFGVSPKAYALHRQCLFAKQLLHQTRLPITQIAFASGFSSVRRFNDTFRQRIGLAPRDIRRQHADNKDTQQSMQLTLSYRPPYAWQTYRNFMRKRAIAGLEWVEENAVGRHFLWAGTSGHFTAHHQPQRHAFRVELALDDLRQLAPVVANIRRILDLDADCELIEQHLATNQTHLPLLNGLRLPGTWSPFEAMIRAVLGQQVSLIAARRLTQQLVNALGQPAPANGRHFPGAEAIAGSDLTFLGMPGRRRQTLIDVARASLEGNHDFLNVSGIGPWTRDYARLRGDSNPDVWLTGDAGLRRALKQWPDLDAEQAAPWRSYLLMQLWSLEDERPHETQ
ncbi:DNA-3-methyladenine glycosylase 2 family protein [Halomonas huangheensis]|uniref:HTH araC/xylS-type domain-containing protein n=1 Tax=Halomonas huangheensis TaxID=1178482 RepID=W1N528_9GAMM|nr:AlkA N-terminal domain-containing protein [Halomonas huangheensis]ALM51560.1 transcriptional regulator [Halomonas huangheensis]ERL50035.1 hypothetical protein BJB45_02590 [Halomonas huangheensis]